MTDVARRLGRSQARKLVSKILASGTVTFTHHAREELAKDDMTLNDAANVLAGGRMTEEGEQEHGTWRYRLHTQRMCVVVAFRSEAELVVVTAWRKKP